MGKYKGINILALVQILFWYCIQAQSIVSDTTFNNLLRNCNNGWIAGDATYSIALPDGKTMWLFGDTFIGTVEADNSISPGAKMIRNSAVLMNKDSLQTLYTGSLDNPGDFIPTNYPDSIWYWPEHGMVENDTLKIFLAKYKKNPAISSSWNFVHTGQYIANFSYPEIQLLNIIPLSYADNNVLYGVRILYDSNYTYVYGRKEEDISGFNIPYPHVARFTQNSNEKWSFFDGSSWSQEPEQSAAINSFQVSQQYGVIKHNEIYILITQDIWLSPEIYSFTSSSPTGPWENKTLIYTTPIFWNNTFTYNAYPHPQFDTNNQLLISYNTNGDFWEIFKNVETYRPRFIRVPYEIIEYGFTNNVASSNKDITNGELNIYPNPAHHKITLQFDTKKECKAVFTIYNTSGQPKKQITIHNTTSDNNSRAIDISVLPAGIYEGVLTSKSGIATKRIVKL